MSHNTAGAGSPVFFNCPVYRRDWHEDRSTLDHVITLTGRTKPFKPNRAMGIRSTFVSREYTCSCGHTGWSNHVDLERMESRLEYEAEIRDAAI